MDYIREFDIRLEKEMYYAGELLCGVVKLETTENFKILEKVEGSVPILPRGTHQFPFRFQLPETSLPCSFESKCGTIRYYLKVTIDIPYASPPQGIKYFTIIGPHTDCMDDTYLKPIRGACKRKICCLCCERRIVSLCTQLDRSAYCCGESLRVKADIDNQSDKEARLKLKLVQHVEYFIDRGVLGVEKQVSHTILEYRSAPVKPHTRTKWDSKQSLVVSTMPPTLVGICRLIQIYYVLKAHLELEKSGEDLHMNFPITIGTIPFRIPNSKQKPKIQYDVASDHVEGGMYIGPEFQLGQVYDGTVEFSEAIVLYRPVYITVVPASAISTVPQASGSASSSLKSKPQRNSVQKPSSSGLSSVKKTIDSAVKEKLNRSSTAKSKVQKLNSLSVAPPSLQSIAKKRSSLPETSKGIFDFHKPLLKLESIDITKKAVKINDNVVRFEADVVEPGTSKNIDKIQETELSESEQNPLSDEAADSTEKPTQVDEGPGATNENTDSAEAEVVTTASEPKHIDTCKAEDTADQQEVLQQKESDLKS